jgi:hypothetical protein
MAEANNNADVIEAKPANPITVMPKTPAKPLQANRLRLIVSSASDISNKFAAVLPTGTPFTAALEPGFWANVCSQLRISDVIDVHSDTRLFFGTIYVRDTSKTSAQVAQLEYHEFDTLAESVEPASYKVKYSGPHSKWSIERVADGKLVRESFESQESAEQALKAMDISMSKVA